MKKIILSFLFILCFSVGLNAKIIMIEQRQSGTYMLYLVDEVINNDTKENFTYEEYFKNQCKEKTGFENFSVLGMSFRQTNGIKVMLDCK